MTDIPTSPEPADAPEPDSPDNADGTETTSSTDSPDNAPVHGVPAAHIDPPKRSVSDRVRGAVDSVKAWDTRKKVSVATLIALAVVMLVVLSTCRVTVVSSTVEGESVESSTDAALPTQGRDGDFEFETVSSELSDGVGVGGEGQYPMARPEGEFRIVTFTVRNTSEAPKLYSPVPQKLLAIDGESYPADTQASSYLYANPIHLPTGELFGATVVFDVPKGTEVRGVELHESVGSRGVRLSIPVERD